MSTDFFARQDAARKNTVRLIVLFTVSVILIVCITTTIAFFATQIYVETNRKIPNNGGHAVGTAIIVGLLTLGLISSGTFFKVVGLRVGGGKNVAESVGGLQLNPNMKGMHERRVLNVVEEMAIASGTPVPPVYLLEEDSINAFAAGYSPSDAVIGVTRGAVQNLSREQLQGVIAHEFSHILNGDMRMNIRLIGILHGILLLHLLGSMLLRSLRFAGGSRRGSRDSGGGQAIAVMLVVGLALFIVGYVGYALGGLIKAAVSRQREYLADASAVQFTRNPNGIGGALKAIGAISFGSSIQHPGAELVSHMYFATGVVSGFTRMTATHPPLSKRILAIDPNWDGQYPPLDATIPISSRVAPQASGFAGDDGNAGYVPSPKEVPVEEIRDATEHIGAPEEDHREYAAKLIADLPDALVEAAHEPYSARALVFALLLDRDRDVRKRQLIAIGKLSEAHLVDTTDHLWRLTGQIPEHARLPLLDMTLPALRTMSTPQYVSFMRAFAALADADDRHSVFEWALAQILIRHLKPQFVTIRPPKVAYYSLSGLTEPISVLLSTMSRIGHGEEWVEPSFEQGRKILNGLEIKLLPKSTCSLKSLHQSVKKLAQSTAKIRGLVIDACAFTISADGHVTVSEAELLRGIADLLDCPVPPWLHTINERAAE